jgi:hypothetical protein
MTRDAILLDLGRGSHGVVLPGTQLELRRRIEIHSGALVAGAVLGHSIVIRGPATVAGSIFATSEVILDGRAGRVLVEGPVSARGALTGLGNADGGVVIEGDVCAPRVRLLGADIVGAVLGEEAVLERCVVFGAAEADRELRIRDSYAASFCADTVTLEGAVLLGTAAASARAAIHMESAQVASAVLCDLAADESGASPLIPLTADDIQVLSAGQSDVTPWTRHLVTLGPRAMRLTHAATVLDANKALLRRLARRHHLSPEAAAQVPRGEEVAKHVRRWLAPDLLAAVHAPPSPPPVADSP